jgi:hypothetical protein
VSLPWNRPEQQELDWLRRQGVSEKALDEFPHIGTAYVLFDGNLFEEVYDGQRALTFVIHDCGEFIDFAAWQPRTGELTTWRGAGFAIGQDQIFNPATYFDGGALRVSPPNPNPALRREGNTRTPVIVANFMARSFGGPGILQHDRWPFLVERSFAEQQLTIKRSQGLKDARPIVSVRALVPMATRTSSWGSEGVLRGASRRLLSP